MNAEHIQNLRYKLQKRVRRLNSSDHKVFHYILKQFWGFLTSNSILFGILEDLERRYPTAEDSANKIINDRQQLAIESELENAAVSYFILKKCTDSEEKTIEINIASTYIRGVNYPEKLDLFRELYLEPFYEYLDEQLDDQKAILALLKRYKHKCEWFQRNSLYRLWEEDTQRGEKRLGLHLFEYLHDQGLDFTIEPLSASGEADLVGAQEKDDPLLADTKIFNPEKGKGKDYIARGFNQLYLYSCDYNQPFGYLIIYKTTEDDLRLALANQEQSTPFVIHNNKTIFLITIDIFPHETSASKRGPLKTVEITQEDLIRVSNC